MMEKGAIVGWALGSLAVAIGYVNWGWPGVFVAVTLVVFWLLLQFSHALRSLREAGSAPVGTVESAVMLHAQMRAGMRLPQVLRHTGSLGRKVADEPETYEWQDASGACVRAEFQNGQLVRWHLARPQEPEPSAT